MRKLSLHNAYLVTNMVTGQQYIGIVRNRSVAARWTAHLSSARNGRGYALHEAIREWGADAFECHHIACAINRDDLNETEKILVEQYDCYWPRGYNRTRGGSRTFAVGKPITFDGRYYGSLSELAAEFGVDAQNVHQRVKKYGWTLRQALEIDPPREQIRTGPAKLTNVDGVTYPSFRAAAVALGIDEGQVRTRMTKYGWTMEEAFGVIPRKRANKALKAITIAGISYSSLAQAANKYGINSRFSGSDAGRLDA